MAEEIEDNTEVIVVENQLTEILDMEMSLLATISDLTFPDDFYDEYKQDLIQCVARSFKVINTVQNAIQSNVRKQQKTKKDQ
jgi:hypothetical protein